MNLTKRQRWFLCHATRTNRWLAHHGGIQLGTVRETWRCLFRKLGLPPAPYKCKRIPALIQALKIGLIEIGDIDPAWDERKVPPGWCAQRYDQVIGVLNEQKDEQKA